MEQLIFKIFGVSILLYAGYVIIKLIIQEFKTKENRMDNVTLYSITILFIGSTLAMIYYVITIEITMELIKSYIR